jgi:Sulfotransferase family
MPVAAPGMVDIDDLATPQFPAEAAAVFAAMAEAAPGCVLEPASLMATAVTQTGLEDFGDPSFREPLEVLCRALRTEAGLSAYGVVTAQSQLVDLLKNRLLITDLLSRHPEIHQVPLNRPIVVAGLARSGTTHLHNLLSADPALRCLQSWEAAEPVLPDAERPRAGQPDPRIARTAARADLMNTALPYMRRMHEITVDLSAEDIHLLAIDFSGTLFLPMSPIPSYWEWYDATDQTGAYRYLRMALQVLTWLRGGERWVLKAPQHLDQLGTLMTVFPDATVVMTHRDPVPVVASVTTMLAYISRLYRDTVDLRSVGRFWADRAVHYLNAAAADRDLVPAHQSADVMFGEFMADPLATAERIYAGAGQPFTAQASDALAAYQASHPRGRHGTVRYDLARFGLDAAELRHATSRYAARFGVREE